jgi:hypothetical protein
VPDLSWITAAAPVLVAALSTLTILIRLRYRQRRLHRRTNFLLVTYLASGRDVTHLRAAAAALKLTEEPSAIAAMGGRTRRTRSTRRRALPPPKSGPC